MVKMIHYGWSSGEMKWSSGVVEWSSGVVELFRRKVEWSSGEVELSSRKVEWFFDLETRLSSDEKDKIKKAGN